MGDCYIEIPFEHNIAGEFPKGCHIYYEHRMFSLKATSFPEGLTAKNGYKYTLRFYAPQHRMEDCVIKWSKGGITETTFELTATLRDIAQLICDNMNSFLGVSTWKVGTIPTKFETATRHISFDGKSAWDKLPDITSSFDNTEWWVIDDDTEVTLNFGKFETGAYEDLVEGDIIKKLPTAKRGEDADYGTRFYVFGGTHNIPDDYYANEQGGVTNHVSEKRLHLPEGKPYIDAFEGMVDGEIIEKSIFLEDIFPKNTETITEVTTREAKVDGVTTTYYIITCANTAFKPSMIISSLSAVFTSGSLQGREFSLNTNGDSDLTFNKSFEIYTQREGSGDSSVVIPNEYLRPQVGDTFILTGVKLPNEYVENAEKELLDEAIAIIEKRCADTNVYECQTNPVFCAKNNKNLQLGQRVKLIGGAFGPYGRSSRIQGFEKKLYNEYDAIYSVGDNRAYQSIKSILDNLNGIIDRNNDRLSNSQSKNDSKLDFTGTIINNEFKKVNDELKSTTDKLGEVTLEVKKATSSSAEAKLLATDAQTTAQKASEGLSANKEALFAIEKRLQVVEGNTDISALKLQVATNTSNITNLDARVGVAFVGGDEPILMRMSPMNRGEPAEASDVVSIVDDIEEAVIIEETTNDDVVVSQEDENVILEDPDETVETLSEDTTTNIIAQEDEAVVVTDSEASVVITDDVEDSVVMSIEDTNDIEVIE